MVYVGKNWLKVWNTLWNSEFPPMELLERWEYQLYFWGKCWVQSSVDNLEKSIITSIILNPTFFVSLKKQNCVKKNTHLNPQDPFLFNIFYLQLKRDRDTDHHVVDEFQQKDLQSTHIFPRLRCLLLSCTKTIWWYTMASFLLKVFQAPLFLLKRSDFNGYHIACDWNWTGHVLLSFGRVYPQYIKQSIIWIVGLSSFMSSKNSKTHPLPES